jgi:hypothetical protein
VLAWLLRDIPLRTTGGLGSALDQGTPPETLETALSR